MSQGDVTAPAALEVDSLTTGYNGMPIVHEVSLAVRPGETACVVGPNGCGKSTLLKALAGLLPVFSGSVRLSGTGEVTGRATPELVRAGIGYVPQVNDVFPPLSVVENLEVGGYPLKKSQVGVRKEAVLEMFPKLRPMLSRHAGRLSGGERKMLAMARVLMLEPHVLLLDEPTAGLTEEMASRLLDDQLAQLKRNGIAVLLVEQRANLALRSADYAYVLSSGRVRREGDAAALTSDPTFAHVFLGGVDDLPVDSSLATES